MQTVFSDICEMNNATLEEFNGESDHVHLLVTYPPRVALSILVNSLKGVSSRRLRQYIYIQSQKGEAKFWLDPQIELAKNYKLSRRELNEIEKIIEEHYEEFIKAWEDHFGNRSN